MLQLILLEKKTLLKGLLFSFLVVLPFTFIPAVLKEGILLDLMIERIPLSLLYSTAAAFIVCGSALIYNYDRQKIKLELFSKPAFTNLGFEYNQSGKGSLTEDLSFFLKGNYQDREYIIDMTIDLEDMKDRKVWIIPIIGTEKEGETHKKILEYTINKLRRDFKVAESERFLQLWFTPEEINVENPLAISKLMNLIEAKMSVQIS